MPSSPGYHPGFVAIPDTVQLRLIWTLPNVRFGTNVLHGGIGTGDNPSPAKCDAFVNSLAASAGWAAYNPFLAGPTNLTAVDMRDLRGEGGQLVQSTVAPLSGTGTGAALPEEVALCLSIHSAIGGKHGRGRVYLPGLSTDGLDADGHVTSDLVTATLSLADGIKAAFIAAGLSWVVASRGHDSYTSPFTGLTVAADGPHSFLITNYKVDNVFDSQRRRK
jgi:hypothetical protein